MITLVWGFDFHAMSQKLMAACSLDGVQTELYYACQNQKNTELTFYAVCFSQRTMASFLPV
jgi:hypothetical protein